MVCRGAKKSRLRIRGYADGIVWYCTPVCVRGRTPDFVSLSAYADHLPIVPQAFSYVGQRQVF
jgi:hypothetical protein